ncbi:MAG: molybdopterin-guanine dinucleotide biosynthesis protein B [Asgard group archaeon]|nr:molybdopterin-guanine dinucleotide biosynthesis protein B [Asgard group archaeon]
MKVFSIYGYSNSGKTTTTIRIIKELVKRNYKVNAIKSVHIRGFSIDKKGKDSWRHWQAGAQTTAIRALNETSIIYRKSMTLKELIPYFDCDYLVLEGFSEEEKIPKILCAKELSEIEELFQPQVFVIAGVISNKKKVHKGIPIVNGVKNTHKLVDLIEKKAMKKEDFLNP